LKTTSYPVHKLWPSAVPECENYVFRMGLNPWNSTLYQRKTVPLRSSALLNFSTPYLAITT